MAQVACILDSRSQLGEGAVWDGDLQRLWWVDIEGCLIHRFNPETGHNEAWDFGEKPGCLAPTSNGELIVAAKTGFYRFDPATGAKKKLSDPEADLPGNRFNDGTTDRQGRFWAGTMKDGGAPETCGNFYRLDADGACEKVFDGFFTTNGSAYPNRPSCKFPCKDCAYYQGKETSEIKW
jgi:sugar lactone lactonase YvrE